MINLDDYLICGICASKFVSQAEADFCFMICVSGWDAYEADEMDMSGGVDISELLAQERFETQMERLVEAVVDDTDDYPTSKWATYENGIPVVRIWDDSKSRYVLRSGRVWDANATLQWNEWRSDRYHRRHVNRFVSNAEWFAKYMIELDIFIDKHVH